MTTTTEERLARLEALLASQAAAPPPPSGLARLAALFGAELPKLLAAAVLLVLGFALKDSVDLAIKQRQLDLGYSKEMQSLLLQLNEGGSLPQMQSAAVVLASYGEAALPALLSELRHPLLRGDAAAEGLNVLALRDPELVCAALPRLLKLRKQYDWQTHNRIVRMLGQYGCVKAREPLRQYRLIVQAAKQGQPARFLALVREAPVSPAEDYPTLLTSVDESLAMLAE